MMGGGGTIDGGGAVVLTPLNRSNEGVLGLGFLIRRNKFEKRIKFEEKGKGGKRRRKKG